MNPKKNIPVKKNPAKAATAKQTQKSSGGSLLNVLENFCSRNSTALFITACILTVLFSVLLFDVKMSNANDDSMYVEGGWKFSKDYHNLYTANAPLYPMFLSIFIGAFGLKVILLKAINVVFILLQIVFLFLAFRKRVPHFVLMTVLFLTALNSYFQYFASQTFTEAFFCAMQGLFFYAAFKVYDKVIAGDSLKSSWMNWLFLGLVMFLLAMIKNVAVLAPVVFMLFLLIDKKFAAAGLAVLSFLFFRVPYEIIKKIIWPTADQYSGQGGILMLKDPYDATKGKETLSGFVSRFFQNTELYISKRFFQILGFTSPDSTDTNGALVLFFVIVLFAALFILWKNKNSILLFTTLYFLAFMSATFVILQIQWDQPRLIMVYVPLILIVVFTGYYQAAKNYSSLAQMFLVFIMFVVLASSAMTTINKAANNFDILKENISGNIYFGYTEDWVNYLRLSEYCGDSLPPQSYVAARKAPMSFIYAKGKQFFPVYNAFATDADSVLNVFKREKVTHVIVASLRSNPKENTGQVINTMQRLLYPVTQKYPNKFTLVKQMGESEPAYLYKINY